MAKRHGLIEATIASTFAKSALGYPWQNATASLKRYFPQASWRYKNCYPWQNATASLKLLVPSMTLSFAAVIRGKTPRPH